MGQPDEKTIDSFDNHFFFESVDDSRSSAPMPDTRRMFLPHRFHNDPNFNPNIHSPIPNHTREIKRNLSV